MPYQIGVRSMEPRWHESNVRHPPSEGGALSTELQREEEEEEEEDGVAGRSRTGLSGVAVPHLADRSLPHGTERRARTPDILVNSEAFCRLNYLGRWPLREQGGLPLS